MWSSLPSSPGVYWFLDDKDTVLYVGKAKNLKNRIASYKQWESTTGKTRRLVFHATKLKHEVLESELEALLIEAELIRTHQPQYNILLKDDKIFENLSSKKYDWDKWDIPSYHERLKPSYYILQKAFKEIGGED